MLIVVCLFCAVSSGHCVGYSYAIYGFWLLLWYFQTLPTIYITIIALRCPRLVFCVWWTSKQFAVSLFYGHRLSLSAVEGSSWLWSYLVFTATYAISVHHYTHIYFMWCNRSINTESVRLRVIVLNATFNNISAKSVLLVEKTGVTGEDHWPVVSHSVFVLYP
jgi:hypothetical protein